MPWITPNSIHAGITEVT